MRLTDAELGRALDALLHGPRGAGRVDVRVVWDPPWTPERLTQEAVETLRLRR